MSATLHPTPSLEEFCVNVEKSCVIFEKPRKDSPTVPNLFVYDFEKALKTSLNDS